MATQLSQASLEIAKIKNCDEHNNIEVQHGSQNFSIAVLRR